MNKFYSISIYNSVQGYKLNTNERAKFPREKITNCAVRERKIKR